MYFLFVISNNSCFTVHRAIGIGFGIAIENVVCDRVIGCGFYDRDRVIESAIGVHRGFPVAVARDARNLREFP